MKITAEIKLHELVSLRLGTRRHYLSVSCIFGRGVLLWLDIVMVDEQLFECNEMLTS